MSIRRGQQAESKARLYLQKQGLKWVESNFNCRLGEIDLIFKDREYLVFVEVRARASGAYGNAIDSIHEVKQQKILRTALYYLSFKKYHESFPIRFDVVAFDGTPPQITWIKDAFGA